MIEDAPSVVLAVYAHPDDADVACGGTLAQDPPAPGQVYIVKPGDSLASIARQADPSHAATLASSLARVVGSSVVVPGEHVQIP